MLKSAIIARSEGVVGVRIIAAILLAVWLILVLIGKGGFVHILLLTGMGIVFVEILIFLRTRLK